MGAKEGGGQSALVESGDERGQHLGMSPLDIDRKTHITRHRPEAFESLSSLSLFGP